MPDKFSLMSRSEVDHEARLMTNIVESMLRVLSNYVDPMHFDMDEFIDDVSEVSDCDIKAIWDDLRESTAAEIKERVETEFDDDEIETIKKLIADGQL